MKINKDEIKKILIIKFGGIGDVLLSTPVIENIRLFFPDSGLYFLTGTNSSELLKDNPYLTRLLTFGFTREEYNRLSRTIRKQKYDLIIDLYSNFRTALVTFRSGAKYRAGYNLRFRKFAYNYLIEPRSGEKHNVDFNLDALKKLNIPIISKKLNITLQNAHDEFANNFITQNNLDNNLIGILISGGWESKKFKVNDYIKLIGKILQKYNSKIILFWGTENEKKECVLIKDNYPNESILIPKCNLRYAAAIIKKCKIIIGNDSGLLHVATAVNVPVLGIYGPTSPKLQGPYGNIHLTIVNENINCLNCGLLNCNIGNICMTELSKEKIIDKVDELIELNQIRFW